MVNLLKRLDEESLSLVETVGSLAKAQGVKAFLVGGPVRDLILQQKTVDLDIVIEGKALAIAEAFAAAVNGKMAAYPAFKTATVTLPDGRLVDFVTARKEVYPKPGVFPVVTPSTLKDDLFRRDFTINAMAICINPTGWGKLVDPFSGMKDLKSKKIRVMHDKSFLDDPTRIHRAARFAGRLGFEIERRTQKLIDEAVSSGAVSTVKGNRILKETKKIEKEKNKSQITKHLKQWGMGG